MKEKINYEGQEIWVDEKIKTCLDELKREKEVQDRRNRRHELLWDSMMIEEIENHKEILPIEDDVINALYIKALDKLIGGLEEIDKRLIIDRFINKMKYSEMADKYSMPDSTIDSRIKKILELMKSDFDDMLRNT
jgi:DNA-directed RNA polymerase specialized sigma24 family protein